MLRWCKKFLSTIIVIFCRDDVVAVRVRPVIKAIKTYKLLTNETNLIEIIT